MRNLTACGLGGLEVREDTGLLAVDVSSRGESAAAGGCGGGGSAFMIREDTNLKGFHLQVFTAWRFHAHLLY